MASASNPNEGPKEESDFLLDIQDLKTQFFTEEGVVHAVDGINLTLKVNEAVGLVGETGCGKSVTALSIIRLVREPGKIVSGSITFKGVDLITLSEEEMRKHRGCEITMIFQDPLNSLNPVLTIGDQIIEVFLIHQQDRLKQLLKEYKVTKKRLKKLNPRVLIKSENPEGPQNPASFLEFPSYLLHKSLNIKTIALHLASEILTHVGIADSREILNRYPHELSGGMRQRVMIAMALSCNPALLIADEPTTALDVTIEAQILELMKELKRKFQTSILLITHDLGVVADFCDRVAVMYAGKIVEIAPEKDIFDNPCHPYTVGLMNSIPNINKRGQELSMIKGSVPDLIDPPRGCRFHPRCEKRLVCCDEIEPRISIINPLHSVLCHLYDPEYKTSPPYKWELEELEKAGKV